MTPAQLIRDDIRALQAYHVPDASGYIKLDAMENPYRWPEHLVGEWQHGLAELALNLYPDASGKMVTDALYQHAKVPTDAAIMLGNGSDELIQLIIQAVAKPDACIMAPEPSFVMYQMIATFNQVGFVGTPLNDDFSLNLAATLEAIEATQPAAIFLAYPNNPTGNQFSTADIEAIIQAADGLVIIDEAYYAFASDSYLPRVLQHPNLLVMRTLSKVGLAGIRLGFLVGDTAWIHELDKLRLPYNINVMTQYTAQFALQHIAVLESQAEQLKIARGMLLDELTNTPHCTAYPSDANFILFATQHPSLTTRDVHEQLKERQILIKCLDGSHPALNNMLRVTVGTPEQNQQFIDALRAILQ